MTGETNLKNLLKNMRPTPHDGEYVFCTKSDLKQTDLTDFILAFREEEGYTLILKKEKADQLGLEYSFVASWITLNVHLSLEAMGFTAAFSAALTRENISCNVVAGYYHDHLFVRKADRERTLDVLALLSKKAAANTK